MLLNLVLGLLGLYFKVDDGGDEQLYAKSRYGPTYYAFLCPHHDYAVYVIDENRFHAKTLNRARWALVIRYFFGRVLVPKLIGLVADRA